MRTNTLVLNLRSRIKDFLTLVWVRIIKYRILMTPRLRYHWNLRIWNHAVGRNQEMRIQGVQREGSHGDSHWRS